MDIVAIMQLSTRSAIARSTQAYCSLISEAESLSCGVAFRSERFRHLTVANQIREVVVDSAQSAAEAFETVEAYYAAHELECHRWSPTIDADPEVLRDCLSPHGFRDRSLMSGSCRIRLQMSQRQIVLIWVHWLNLWIFLGGMGPLYIERL